MRKFDFVEKAVKNLYPAVVGMSYDKELDEVTLTVPPVDVDHASVRAEVARLESEYDANSYQQKRAAEYPDFRDYLDGIVKNDRAQIEAYVAACVAVKAKYPKVGE